MGGAAGADATIHAETSEIDRLVVRGAGAGSGPPERIEGRKLFIVARDDASGSSPRLPRIQAQFAKMPEPTLQKLATEFKLDGHKWGKLHNLAEVPLFVDSRATRMIQYADMVAYALRRYYEKGEAKYFDIIKHRFDGLGGVIHGLTHQTPVGSGCNCAPCAQRARR